MSGIRKKLSAEFKAKVALAALPGGGCDSRAVEPVWVTCQSGPRMEEDAAGGFGLAVYAPPDGWAGWCGGRGAAGQLVYCDSAGSRRNRLPRTRNATLLGA